MYERPKLSMEDAIKIQDEALAKWELKLIPELYADLVGYAKAGNKLIGDPYEVRRGSDLSGFVENWKPGHKPTDHPSYYPTYKMEVHKVTQVKHSGQGDNSLHSQVIKVIGESGLTGLNDWCKERDLDWTYDRFECVLHVFGNKPYSFECHLLAR